MKYNVGDKVRVRSDLELYGKRYYMENHEEHNTVTDSMSKYCGQVVTILDVSSGQYRIDASSFRWTDEMFEGLAEETPKKFHVYDTVKHKKYGIGTVIEITESLTMVDFDEWHGELMDGHTCFCVSELLTLVQAYTGGEAD